MVRFKQILIIVFVDFLLQAKGTHGEEGGAYFCKARRFYLDEYASLCELPGRSAEFFPLIFFCFLRAGLEDNSSKAAFDRYFDGVWSPDTYLEMIATKAYKNFQEDFLAGKFIVGEKKI